MEACKIILGTLNAIWQLKTFGEGTATRISWRLIMKGQKGWNRRKKTNELKIREPIAETFADYD